MKKMLAMLFVSSIFAQNVVAGPSWASGNMSNITSTTDGLMVMLDTTLPDNCVGTPYGWMLIKEANKTLVATTLAMWMSGNKAVTVYTSGRENNGFCVITQVDP